MSLRGQAFVVEWKRRAIMPRPRKPHWCAFLQKMGFPGLANLSLPAVYVVGRAGNDELVILPKEYGGFLIRRHAIGDPPYHVDASLYRRFDQKHDLFSRLSWDATLRENFLFEAPKAAVKRMQANRPGSSRSNPTRTSVTNTCSILCQRAVQVRES
jgi:hypothetical protein